MLTEAETRLMRLLSTYPSALEKAWDVPRDLSLPGLADRLGVVRSALNPPITSLEKRDLIKTRQTHVIGGGHRKRTVVHITEEGRQIVEGIEPQEVVEKTGEIVGLLPSLTTLYGRDALVEKLISGVEKGATLQLVGLPGIGKTSLLRVVAENCSNNGWNVCWVTMQSHHDVGRITAELLGDSNAPKDVGAASAALIEIADNCLFIIDELQAVHQRHSEAITELLMVLANSGECALAIGCRAPSPVDFGSIFKIDEIADKEALKLLPEDLENDVAEQVVDRLGGHPLALKLWQPGHSLPEADDRIQEFIRTDVVEKLESDVLSTLDELAAAPLPLLADQMSNDDGVAPLDDAALLRWAAESIELQHLVRNVRRTMWDEDEARDIHTNAAKHWAERVEPEARIHEAHHRVQSASNDNAADIEATLAAGIDEMLSIDSAAAAAIISDAINALPSAHKLRLLSTRVAIERGEGEYAEKELNECDSELKSTAEWRLLNARLKRLHGKFDEANKEEKALLEEAYPTLATKIKLNRLVQGLDDRLPGEIAESTKAAIQKGISEIDLTTLAANNRKAALVTIAAIRHTIALDAKDPDTAAKVRTDLARTTSHDDPIIEEMAARAALVIGGEANRIKSIISRTSNPLRRCALGLLLVKHAHETNDPAVGELLRATEHPQDLGTTTARRLSAFHWYWRGVIDSSQRVKCWQESLYRFGMAECANAYIQLQHKLHDSMRLL